MERFHRNSAGERVYLQRAELLSAALKDYGVCTLVGSTTFGKGCAQRFMSSFRCGNEAHQLLLSHPKGNRIQKKGVSRRSWYHAAQRVGMKMISSLPGPAVRLERAAQARRSLEILRPSLRPCAQAFYSPPGPGSLLFQHEITGMPAIMLIDITFPSVVSHNKIFNRAFQGGIVLHPFH